MSTPASLASFDQGLPTPTSQVSDFMQSMKPLYEQWQKLQQNQMNALAGSAAPAGNIPYPDLSSLLDKVNQYYDQYAQKAGDYATQRYQNAANLMGDEFAKKAQRQGLGNQGTLGTTGPESAWRQEYVKAMNEPMNTNYSNIASQAAMGKAGFASGNALQGIMNNLYQQNLQNQYSNNLWKMGLANQYQNSNNPFVNLASIGASLYRGGGGGDNVRGMSGYGTGSGTNVNMGSETKKQENPYSYFPSQDELEKQRLAGQYGMV